MRTIFILIGLCLGYLGALEAVKPNNAELCFMSATELLRRYEAKELSPVDVLQAQIERIEKENPKINAISVKHYDEALAQAKESEKRYLEGNPRPLEGLTCAIKDEVKVKGWCVTMGSLILKDAPAVIEDGAFAERLREMGVIMHMQANVPEFCCNAVTWNRLFGVSRNPWNTTYTPGGSSGGSAAALAAGFTTLATGSDMGGSIRIPAAMTGLYGFKSPYGRIATSLCQYETDGPLARTFEDLNLFQNALSGPNPKVISSIRPKLDYPKQYGDIVGWRIAYDPMDNWGLPMDDTVSKAMAQAVETLRSLGAIVEQVNLGFSVDDLETFTLGLFSTAMGPMCFNEPEKHPDLITPYMASLVKSYAHEASPQHLLKADEWIHFHHKQVQEKVFNKGYKAIIMPTLCTPYIVADLGNTPDNSMIFINGKPYSATKWVYFYTWPWNMLGQYPVLNVPIGITPERIPLGMQIISNTYDDLTAFQIASKWPCFERNP